jgi:hypothetical protein
VFAESQSTSRDPNRNRFLTVQSTISDKIQCDKKFFLPVVCGEDYADAKHQFLGKGQTVLMKNVGVRRLSSTV